MPPPPSLDPALCLRQGPLWLRPWQAQDAAALHMAVHASIDRVGRWLPWCHPGYQLAAAQSWVAFCAERWARGEQYAFAIHHDDHAGVLGGVGLSQLDPNNRHANLGYWIASGAQRQGLCTQASRLLAKFGFAMLGLVRLELVVATDNQASRRCAERIGARFEGVAHRLLSGPHAMPAAIYGLLPENLLAVTQLAPAHNSASAE